jgi:hypothetical protein
MDDLLQFDTKSAANEGVKMYIVKPNGSGFFVSEDGTPWHIVLKGSDSKEYRDAKANMKRTIWNRTVAGQKLTDDDYADLIADVICACVVGWHGVVVEGQPLEFTPENVKMLLTRFVWLFDRVADFVESRENFTPPPSFPSDGGSESQFGSESIVPPRKGRKKAA